MKLTLGWLYYDLMNTYGDRGNVLTLQHRTKERDIELEVTQISTDSSYKDILACDFFMMGGAEDKQQKIVAGNLVGDKRKALQDKIELGIPGVYVCGAYQFLGDYYETADGVRLECANIIPFHTKQSDVKAPRLIGDLVVEITNSKLVGAIFKSPEYMGETSFAPTNKYLIGFENHGGRTYLDNKEMAIGSVLKGNGNNREDQTEGLVYKNTIGTYCHGPILPRNPFIADFLISKALEVKYKKDFQIKPIDDLLEEKNRSYLLDKFGI
ncbi:MAG: cobalamin biosynthesis protein CobQ [Patescibacteria group bacterium]|jgi:hypothetical protein